jgi:hypothetical protein
MVFLGLAPSCGRQRGKGYEKPIVLFLTLIILTT